MTESAVTPEPAPESGTSYRDDDIVYVNPDTQMVVGRLEWSRNGNPKSKPYQAQPGERSWRRHFPYGTYKSMKNAFKLEGKRKKIEPTKTLEEVIAKALVEPYWD